MTNLSQPEVDHRDLANKLAESYRREGYDVIIGPMPTDLPFELGRYRPDLLVRKEQGGFLIKVKSKADRLSLDELSSVADEVKKHDGWRFLLVTSQDVASDGLPGKDDQAASWDKISNRLDHARRLAETGDSEAAFLILWISLEQLLRIHARQAGGENGGKRGHSTSSGDCIFLGRPWGLRDESSPSFSAVLEVQAFVPNGEPRRTQWRTAASSFSVIGRFTRAEWKSRMTRMPLS